MRPAFAVGIGEGLVVLVEGTLIYLICRFIPPAKIRLGRTINYQMFVRFTARKRAFGRGIPGFDYDL